MSRAGDDAEREASWGTPPYKWEVPPPACGGEERRT
jgi:hypothetical protein